MLLCFASVNLLLLNPKTVNPGELVRQGIIEHLKLTASGQYPWPPHPESKFVPCMIIRNSFSVVNTLVETISTCTSTGTCLENIIISKVSIKTDNWGWE